jgi:Skp family chaperone for outer membrane proteins
MPTPFDAALAQLQGILVDLDGDGQADAQIPSNMIPQEQPNALAAGGGQAEPRANALSPGMAAINLISRRAPQELRSFVEQAPANAAMMAAGPILGGIGRAAMAAPRLAAGVLGATGLLASNTEAGAPKLTKAQRRQMEMERMRLEAEGQAAAQRMQAETEALKARGANDAEIAAQRQKQQAEMAEYERQVKLAEHARDTELSRERRFSDTTVGKTMDAMGGLAPVAAGLAAGAISRGATGPGGIVKNYLLPGALGAAGGFTAANAPLAYDAFYTDADNPEKAAYQAYGRELPPTHPRKQEFLDYAGSLSSKNPVREQAGKEFLDDMPKRALMSGIEGLGGGLVGADAVRLMGRGFGAARNALQPGGSSPVAPAAPEVRIVRPIKGKDGITRHYDENGDFTSLPKKK